MKFVPNTVSRAVARQILLGKKHSPTILFGVGVVGVATSTVLACRATLKLEEALQETQENLQTAKTLKHASYSEEDRVKDITYIYIRGAVQVGKLYAPAVVVGSLSVAALAGSHRILSRRNAALTAAYAVLEKGFDKYRERVVDEFGEDKDREFLFGTETHEIERENKDGKTVTVKEVGPADASVYARFFDELSPSWSKVPEYNLVFLKAQQNFANDRLQTRGHLFLNEVYASLGIPHSKAGAVVGWVISKDGDNFVDFGIFNSGNEKARDFVNGREGAILLDFNVDGVIYDKI